MKVLPNYLYQLLCKCLFREIIHVGATFCCEKITQKRVHRSAKRVGNYIQIFLSLYTGL